MPRKRVTCKSLPLALSSEVYSAGSRPGIRQAGPRHAGRRVVLLSREGWGTIAATKVIGLADADGTNSNPNPNPNPKPNPTLTLT